MRSLPVPNPPAPAPRRAGTAPSPEELPPMSSHRPSEAALTGLTLDPHARHVPSWMYVGVTTN